MLILSFILAFWHYRTVFSLVRSLKQKDTSFCREAPRRVDRSARCALRWIEIKVDLNVTSAFFLLTCRCAIFACPCVLATTRGGKLERLV